MYSSQKLILLLLVFTGSQLGSQTILNGDFENHTLTECVFNTTNINYSIIMPGSNGFGAAGELDIWGTACADIFPTGSISPSGDWHVGLNTKPSSFNVDEISLVLSTSLEIGGIYSISYYDKGGKDSLLIGVSMDSISFGQEIFASQPQSEIWNYRSFTFVAQDSFKYITVKNGGIDLGYNHIDDFQISTGTNSVLELEETFVVYPNPVKDLLTINNNSIENITLTDQFGNKLNLNISKGVNKCFIDMSNMNSGLYILIVKTNEKFIIEKIMKM